MSHSRSTILLLILLSTVLVVGTSLIPAVPYLALVAFVPALFALHGLSVRQTIRWSAVFFFFLAIGSYYWVAHVAHHFGGLPHTLAWLAVALFGLLNIWQGLVGFTLFRWLRDRAEIPRALLFALCFATAWQVVPALFAWDLSLLVRHGYWIIQSIDLAGTYGLDCFIAFANYAIFESLIARRVTRSALTAVFCFAALLGYGIWRSQQIETALADTTDSIRVALIQPNFDSGAKADINNIRDSLDTLFSLSEKAMAADIDLLVWPEATFPIDYSRDPTLQRILNTKVAQWKTGLFFGNNRFEPKKSGGWKSYNSATLIAPGHEAQYYSKRVLLAFGEYIPFEDVIPMMRTWFPDRVGNFGRGKGPTQLAMPPFSFAPVICYESIIGEYMRQSAALPVDFITEITNDGWYGRTTALRYHKDLTVLRAIENRITVARDTNTGITTFIDPLGREDDTQPLETPAIAIRDIRRHRPYSVFTHYGHHAQSLGLLALVILMLRGRWLRGRSR